MVNNWLKIAQKWLSVSLSLPCHCLLCLQKSREIALCHSCEKNLPWLNNGCITCALPLSHQGICGNCLLHPPAYEKLQALFNYRWPLNIFVGQLKYAGKLHFAKLLGFLLAQNLQPLFSPHCIVPMPLHSQKQCERGFNQTLEIARSVAKTFEIPLDYKSCKRIIYNSAQTHLNAQKRAINITAKHFAIASSIQGKHILVIEDVVTTGTTILAFAQALKQAGARSVEVWACCRAALH